MSATQYRLVARRGLVGASRARRIASARSNSSAASPLRYDLAESPHREAVAIWQDTQPPNLATTWWRSA